MFCYRFVLFLQVPLLHFQHLTAVVCPHGLYLGLQCFDGFLVCGYLPMQGGVLPLQRLDLVAPEKRTDTLSDVGGCGCGSPFQPFGLYFFFARTSSSCAVSLCSCNSTTSVFSSSVCRFMSR